ncbi:hypothetical protein IIB34_03885, partial [PVC group bacterium]|nr:hypothetical protein [PVC group bacterium]
MPEHAFQNLVQVVDRLHRRDGCPWDRALKLKDLRKYILEEAHEVIEAINDNDLAKLKDELGDLLFQVLTCAKLADKKKSFCIADVLINTKKKMLRRHPHVFGGDEALFEATYEGEVVIDGDRCHVIFVDLGNLPSAQEYDIRWFIGVEDSLPRRYDAYLYDFEGSPNGF